MSKSMRVALFGLMVVQCLAWFALAADLKLVHLERGNIKDPVKVVRILVGGKGVNRPFESRNVSFDAREDWLQQLVVVIKNESPKTLVSAEIVIDFPELGDGRSPDRPFVSVPITLGVTPEHYLYNASGEKAIVRQETPISIAPGQELVVSVGKSLDRIRAAVETKGKKVPEITECWVRLRTFFFEDGTRWSPISKFARPDPQVPGKYINLSPDEFYTSSSITR